MISLAGVVELRIQVSASAMISALWLLVRSLSTIICSGVSMERVLTVQMRKFERRVGPVLGWMSPQRSVAMRKDMCISECYERRVEIMQARGSLFK